MKISILIVLLSVYVSHAYALNQKNPHRAKVEFREAESEPGRELEELRIAETGERIYVHRKVLIANKDIKQVSLQPTYGPLYEVVLTFTDRAAQRVKMDRRFRSGQRLAILVDGVIVSAPVVRGDIYDRVAISNTTMTREKAERLARTINDK